MSHPLSRQFLTEGFVVDYSKASVDLTTEPDFMAFYTFHGQVCVLWNAIVEEVMKNDCVDPANPCPEKSVYITTMKTLYNTDNPPVCFINCDKPWDAKSSLEDLLDAIPDKIDCYRGTLTYILNKSNAIMKQVNDSLSQIPPQGFADYQTQITCSKLANGSTQCKDSKGDVYTPQQQSQQSQQQSQTSVSEAAKKQLSQTNQIIGRCRVMHTEIPKLKQLLEQAKKNVEILKEIKKKAQDGSLLPPPAKT